MFFFFLFDLYWSLIRVFWLCEEVNRYVAACGECSLKDVGIEFKEGKRFFFFWRLVRGRNAQNHCDHWRCTWTKIWEQIVLGGWLDMCMLSNNITYFQFLYSLFFFKLWLKQLKMFNAWLSWTFLVCWYLPALCWCLLPFSQYLSRSPVWMDGCDTHKASEGLLDIIPLSFMNSWEAPVSEVVALETTLNFNNNYFM